MIKFIFLVLNFAYMAGGMYLLYKGVFEYYYYHAALESLVEHFDKVPDIDWNLKFDPSVYVILINLLLVATVTFFTSLLGCVVPDSRKEWPKSAYIVLLCCLTVLYSSLGAYGLFKTGQLRLYIGHSGFIFQHILWKGHIGLKIVNNVFKKVE